MAQHFAGTCPEMVDRVILCDCTPRYNDEARANWPVRAGLARQNGVASLIPMLEKIFFTQASLDENGPNVRYVKESWATCSGEATRSRARCWRWWTRRRRPGACRCPR